MYSLCYRVASGKAYATPALSESLIKCLKALALFTSSPQPTQIEGNAILCTDVLSDVTTLTEIINLNCIPSVQVHDTAVTRPLPLALGSATPDYIGLRLFSML